MGIPDEAIPVVGITKITHCNKRTDYELIEHFYNPTDCSECANIENIIREAT